MNRWQLTLAARHLRRGSIIAYPTEAVFGLGCDPMQADSVVRLLALKRRQPGQGFILIGARAEHLAPYIRILGGPLRDGELVNIETPTTWVVDGALALPWWLRGPGGTVAVRVTDHPIAASICRAFGGAIVSTSANLHGRRPARSAREVRVALPVSACDFVVSGSVGGASGPSQIIDARTGRVIRAASPAPDAIRARVA